MTATMGGDLMGVRQLARHLGVNASTISRQIAKGIIPNRGTPEQPMVSLAEAERARAANLDPSKQRDWHPRAAQPHNPPHLTTEAAAPASNPGAANTEREPDSDEDDAEAEEAAAVIAPRTEERSGFNRAATAHKAVQARLAQLDLEERTGRLVGMEGVRNETATQFQALADRVQSAARGIAGRLATMGDEREIAQLLRQTLDQAMNDLSAELMADAAE